ncbi:Solute carrier family 28 member 3 [Microtus ochrogaster]|uniref:Solute carrier family 28 member 3 n=1 Tax=Microtus ochrogaster TaxID=79684 RepID=A0A8J6G758_MICOH|nr:Solute carrier family 28 member 3 [Microtus ochrogaster]
MSRSEQGKNAEPSGPEVSLELRPTAPGNQGRSNAAFQVGEKEEWSGKDEDFEEQNTPGNSAVRSRSVQSREQGDAKQGDRQITIEQESLGNKEDMEDDDQDERQKGCLERKYDLICEFYRKHRIIIRRTIGGILLTVFLALVIAACVLNFHRALPLFVITVVTIFFVIWDHLMAKYEQQIDEFLSPGRRLLDRHWFWLKWVMWSSLILAVIFWLILDTAKLGNQQLVSFGGLVMYIILLFLFSKHPTRVLPIVVFFSTVMSVLYYVGLMQWVVRKVGWLMLVTMGSSPIESVVAAGNIFVGQTESPLLVQPYLPHVTRSELHAIMTAGFATIAGSVLGAYISFGVSSTHLLTASVMSAPASLAVAKLFWPETEKPKVTLKNAMKIENGDSRNFLEAATQGASSSIPLVANIAVNLIAFLALLSFVNSALSWFGNMFDYPQLSFELLCSYIFMPFSFMMGVDWQDSFMVAKLIGYKTFFNEFVAYDHLSKLISLRKAAGPKFVNGVQQYMSGYSGSMCHLASIAPSRKRDIASGAVRALIAGTAACFMTACIAGILSSTPSDIDCHHILGNTNLLSNTTQVLSCCQSLLSSTVIKGPDEVIPGGNFSLYAVKSCCELLKPLTLNCSWISPATP